MKKTTIDPLVVVTEAYCPECGLHLPGSFNLPSGRLTLFPVKKRVSWVRRETEFQGIHLTADGSLSDCSGRLLIATEPVKEGEA